MNNSYRCAQCGLINWTIEDVCKRCGAANPFLAQTAQAAQANDFQMARAGPKCGV